MSTDPAFQMTVEDVFFIRGRGTVVTGKIEAGTLKIGDQIASAARGRQPHGHRVRHRNVPQGARPGQQRG